MKQSPIFIKTYDLMAWLIPRTLAFPKSQRGVLARQAGHLEIEDGGGRMEKGRGQGAIEALLNHRTTEGKQ